MSKKVEKKERCEEIDFVRGVAIILVVLAHCIQCGNGSEYYSSLHFFDNAIYKVIYSFHMPLLMVISGWLFAVNINKRSILKNFMGRVKAILLPVFMWNLLLCMRHLLSMNFIAWLKNYLYTSITTFWFLWAVFYASIGMLFIHALSKKKVMEMVLLIISFIITFVTPDILNAECYKFMWPCFVMGFYANKNKKIITDGLSKIAKFRWIAVSLGVFLFIVGILLYNRESYIYTSGWTLLNKSDSFRMLLTDGYRVLLGCIGSGLCIWLSKVITKCFSGKWSIKVVNSLGKSSLGIYIVSTYCNIILQRITVNFKYNLLITIGETIVILGAAYLVTRIIQFNKWTSKLFLGGRR